MMSEEETKAQTLLEEGKLALKNGELESSVSKLGEACQLLDQINGDLSPKNGASYFNYGQALLQYAIQRNTVLGQSAQASATAVEEQQEFAKEEQAESTNPLVQVGAMPDFKDDAAEEEEEEEEEEGGETADDDFEAAWEVLDVARATFEKSDDKESKLNLADVHLCMGDVSLETEKFDEALLDYEKAIEIKKSVLEEDNRELAEAHYKYALALEYSTDKADQAVPQLQMALAVLKKRIETLEVGEGKGKGKAVAGQSKDAQDEIAEINEFIPDIELKIEELSTKQATEKEAAALLKAIFSANGDIKVKEISAETPVNDLSTLVKRKVKEVVKEEVAAEKKQKLD